ncbi:MAG: NPCBM/NEW2 domain-containing protein [Planctomycetes bacterium]|nr:NPCBM/NEW2 domain-containing protein [Planctomycetota bacterium]
MRFTRRAATLVLCALAVALVTTEAPADDVTTTAGKKISGKLVGVDAQGITFGTSDAKVPIAARDIVLVDFGNKPAPVPKDATYSEVELTDGSTFRVAKFALKGKKIETELLPGPTDLKAPVFELPMSSVFSAMKRADDPKQREAWKKMLATRGKRDLYVIRQETGLTFQQGTIHEGSADGKSLTFENESGARVDPPLLQSRSAGLVFYQPQLTTVPPTLCRVHDVYGNVLTASAINVSQDGILVATVAGAQVKYPSAAALVRLDYEQGNVAYLSDLEPRVDAPEVPAEERKLNPAAPVLKDRSLSNDSIKLDNAIFSKGLCIAPDTVLTFNLNGDYSQFKATAGIDENGANATSAARLTIEADGQVLFSEVLRRKEKGKGVTLAVKGAKQLRLIVEADTPFNGNYVTLAEARVQK